MKSKLKKFLFFGIFLTANNLVQASDYYDCSIMEVKSLGENGKLQSPNYANFFEN